MPYKGQHYTLVGFTPGRSSTVSHYQKVFFIYKSFSFSTQKSIFYSASILLKSHRPINTLILRATGRYPQLDTLGVFIPEQ